MICLFINSPGYLITKTTENIAITIEQKNNNDNIQWILDSFYIGVPVGHLMYCCGNTSICYSLNNSEQAT